MLVLDPCNRQRVLVRVRVLRLLGQELLYGDEREL